MFTHLRLIAFIGIITTSMIIMLSINLEARDIVIQGISFRTDKISSKSDMTMTKDRQKELGRQQNELTMVWMQIEGTGFSSQPFENTISIEHVEVPVLKASTSELISILPFDVAPGNHKVKVTVNGNIALYDVLVNERTTRVDLPLAEGNKLAFSFTDPTHQMTFAGDGQYKTSIVQDLDKIDSKINVNNPNITSPIPVTRDSDQKILLKELKVLSPVPGFVSYVSSSNYIKQRQFIYSKQTIEKVFRGERLMIVALLAGNRQGKYYAEITYNDANGPIVFKEPIRQQVELKTEKSSSGNYEALLYFVTRLPDNIALGQAGLEFTLRPLTEPKAILTKQNTFEVKEPVLKLEVQRAFFNIPDRLPLLPETHEDYFNIPGSSVLMAGQAARFYQLFSVNGLGSRNENVVCGFKIAMGKKVFQTYSNERKAENGADCGCIFDFFVPDNLSEGKYSINAWVNGKDGLIDTQTTTVPITVSSPEPAIEMLTWPVRPVKMIGELDSRQQRAMYLANAITRVSRGHQLAILTDLVASGFAPSDPKEKHIIGYLCNVTDSLRTTMRIEGQAKFDKINGRFRIYKPFQVPEQFVPGPIDYTIKVSIDGTVAATANGFYLD